MATKCDTPMHSQLAAATGQLETEDHSDETLRKLYLNRHSVSTAVVAWTVVVLYQSESGPCIPARDPFIYWLTSLDHPYGDSGHVTSRNTRVKEKRWRYDVH
ncbi:hypothetical protein EAI_13035 [Harpegnathos saltator]|uniref:Uncharacterized protein n=1 Tax=Harpegnathos saltator TaxID=610380 RepID=E2B6A0_HARSA|nr:hypothetical protein EAI_13035 [Harpegnathos saltator]